MVSNVKKLTVLFILFIFITSCAVKGNKINNNVALTNDNKSLETTLKDSENANIKDISKNEEKSLAEEVISKKKPTYGKRLVNGKNVVEISKNKDKYEVNLIFDSADVYEVVKTIFTEIIKKSFIIDPQVKGTITLSISGLYSENDILTILAKALDLSNLALVKQNDSFVVTTKQSAKEEITNIYDAGLYGVEIVQLKNISSDYFAKNIAPFASKGAVLSSIPANNSVLIFDKKDNIANIINLVKIIDSEIFKGIFFKIIPVKNIKASEAAALIKEILSSGDVIMKPGVATNTHVTDLKSNNSLLVLSRNEEVFNFILSWLKEIDKKNESDESGVYVYYVENGKAEDIAKLLNDLFDNPTSSSSKGNVIVQGKTTDKTKTKQTSTSKSFVSANLNSDVKIIPDEKNNAIVIKANPEDYDTIMKVIKQIDVEPKQVLIDVLIAEVTYSSTLQYGIQWYLKNQGVKIGDVNYQGIGMLNNGTTLAQDTALGASNILGFAYGLYNPAGSLRFLLSAIEDNSKINILSSPNILAIDNEKATIEVGQDVPTITQTVTNTNSDGTVTNSVQYRTTGILLEVTPHINSKNSVRLEIKQEVSEAQTNKVSGIDSPVFLNRKAETILVVNDQETVVIGGLIQEKKDNSKSGVPFLSKIPILGYLFGGSTNTKSKTELVIAITPKVVHNDNPVQKLSRDFLMRLNEVKEILKSKRNKAFQYGDLQ